MALAKGAVAFRFSGGIETKMAEAAVPATKLLACENAVFTKAVSLRKRSGYSALASIDGLIRLAERDDELLGFTANRCYSHEPTADQWSDTGAVYSLVASDRPAVRTGTDQSAPDRAVNGGVAVYAWEDSVGGVWYTVTDATSGRIHIAPTQADADGISPRCVPAGDVLHIYFANATQGYIYIIVVNPTDPTAAVTPAILVDDLSTTNPVYDAVPTSRTDGATAIAWHERATSSTRIGYVHPSGALGSPLTGLPTVVTEANALTAASPLGIAWSLDADSGEDAITVATRNNDGSGNVVARHYVLIVNNITIVVTQVITPSTSPQRIAVTWTDEPMGWVAVEEAAAEPSQRYVVVNSFSLVAVGTARTQRSVGLASRAWSVGNDAFVYVNHDTLYFNCYLGLRLSDSICVARTLPGLAGDGPTRKHLPSAHVVDDVVSVALPYNERLASADNDQFTETGIRLVTLDYDSAESHQHAQLGRGLYLGGACPQHYDARQWSEQGFHVGPELISSALDNSGALTPSSVYLYRVWYEWTDAQGEIHRGPVSFGTLVTLGGGDNEVRLTLPTLRVTQKPNVRICVARSRAAETGDTAELFRVSSLDPSATGANGYVANDPSVDTVSFDDQMSDDDLATQEPLYTNGGILSNDPCALGSVIARSKRRLFTTDPSDPYTVRFSQELEDGYGVEFTPELVVKVDPLGGPVSALADQDGEIIIWQASAIRAFGGGGPTATGDTATGGFGEPRLISSAAGCTHPESIVLTPEGYIFSSDKGLWQINRSGEVSYVGAAAEGFNAQRTTAATVLPNRTGIVFLTDDGTTLFYDYLFGQWSTFTNHLGLDAAVVSGTYHYLRTDGRVFRETVGSYSDAGQRIRLRLETAWIHVAVALQGFQRFWNLNLLGTWVSPHQLAISHRTNYHDQWTEPWYLDATGESATLSTLALVDSNNTTNQVLTDSTPWDATLTWQTPVSGAMTFSIVFEDGDPYTIEVRDNERYQAGLGWFADLGNVGVLVTDTGSDPAPISAIEDAINDTSTLIQVTTPDPDGSKLVDATLMDGGDERGSFGAGWITGDNANPIGDDPIIGDAYGDGEYGDGEYGGEDADVYQWRYHIGGRGESVRFRFEDFERDGLAGASFELTEMLVEGGVAGPANKPSGKARSV